MDHTSNNAPMINKKNPPAWLAGRFFTRQRCRGRVSVGRVDVRKNNRISTQGGIVIIVILLALANCSPLAVYAPTPIATAAPSPSVTVETETPTPHPAICQVKTGIPRGRLNLRTGAGVRFSVIRVLAEGETLQVIERAPWLQVIDAKGNQGFVNSTYCKIGDNRP